MLDGQNLTERESGELLAALTVPENLPGAGGALLAALRAKGVTAAELRGLGRRMRRWRAGRGCPRHCAQSTSSAPAVDRSGSLNLSHRRGLLAASCGLRRLKHGIVRLQPCRQCRVLEALGSDCRSMSARRRCLAATGFTYL